MQSRTLLAGKRPFILHGLSATAVVDEPRAGEDPDIDRRLPARGWLVFAGVAALAAALILVAGRHLTFFFDEWTWITDRRAFTLDTFLEPHNEHLSLVPVALYQALFRTVGLTHYWPYRVMVLVAHLGVATLVFAYLGRRVVWGLALAGASLVLFFGAAYQLILWPFQTAWAVTLIAGIAMLLLVDRRTTRADAGAAVMGVVALASSGIGVPIVAGVGLELAIRRHWRRLWVAVVPAVLYAIWFVQYGKRTGANDGFVGTIRWTVEFAGATVGGLLGLGSVVGQILLIPLAVVVLWGYRRAAAERRPRLVALLATLVAFWVLIALGRSGSQEPGTSRYLYPGGVLVVLLVGECCAGVAVRRAAATVVGVVVGVAAVLGTVDLFDGGDGLRVISRQTLATASAVDIGTRTVDPAYAAVRQPPPIDGRPVVAAFRALGSPTYTAGELRAQREENRRQADGFLAAAIGMAPTGATPPAGAAPQVTRTRAGTATASGPSCLTLAPTDGVDVEVVSSTPYLRITAGDGPVEIRLRAFADGYFGAGAPFATVPDGEERDLPTPTSGAPRWRVGLRSTGGFEVCGTSGAIAP